MILRPFWQYYGGKWRIAPFYPAPVHDTLVEPFAGAAGYSLRHHDREVVLFDRDPIIVGCWDYLIHASESELLALPDVEDGQSARDLPICQEAQWIIGFWLQMGTASPRLTRSSFGKMAGPGGVGGWTQKTKERLSSQVRFIRHWVVVEGSYEESSDLGPATWFVDPPYSCRAGRSYRFNKIDYDALATWCRSRDGQTIVCEGEQASWLPFRHLLMNRTSGQVGANRKSLVQEVVWTS